MLAYLVRLMLASVFANLAAEAEAEGEAMKADEGQTLPRTEAEAEGEAMKADEGQTLPGKEAEAEDEAMKADEGQTLPGKAGKAEDEAMKADEGLSEVSSDHSSDDDYHALLDAHSLDYRGQPIPVEPVGFHGDPDRDGVIQYLNRLADHIVAQKAAARAAGTAAFNKAVKARRAKAMKADEGQGEAEDNGVRAGGGGGGGGWGA